jgi:hypothetical protein
VIDPSEIVTARSLLDPRVLPDFVTRSSRLWTPAPGSDEVRAAARELYGPLHTAHAKAYTDFSDDDLAVIREFLRRSREVNERHAAWLRAGWRRAETAPAVSARADP